MQVSTTLPTFYRAGQDSFTTHAAQEMQNSTNFKIWAITWIKTFEMTTLPKQKRGQPLGLVAKPPLGQQSPCQRAWEPVPAQLLQFQPSAEVHWQPGSDCSMSCVPATTSDTWLELGKRSRRRRLYPSMSLK